MLYCRGLLLIRNMRSRLVLGWARRQKAIGTGHNLPPINGKDGLAVTKALQSRLIREADML